MPDLFSKSFFLMGFFVRDTIVKKLNTTSLCFLARLKSSNKLCNSTSSLYFSLNRINLTNFGLYCSNIFSCTDTTSCFNNLFITGRTFFLSNIFPISEIFNADLCCKASKIKYSSSFNISI